MTARRARLAVLAHALLLALFAAGPARAGSDAGAPPQFDFAQLAQLAKGTERALAARGARVALIARIGRPPASLPDGIDFTHVGFAVYSAITTADGRQLPGYAVYNLYQSDTAADRSYLRQDYPIDYVAGVHELKTGVLIPSARLQQALLQTIASPRYARLHNPRYAVLANPLARRYQNCTGFVLEVLFAAIYDTEDPRRLAANIQAYFRPQPVRVGGLQLALGALLHPDLRTDDHRGPIATATFGSIARFLAEHDLLAEAFSYAVDPRTLYAAETQL